MTQEAYLTYTSFLEMFDLKDEDWGGYNDEGDIVLLYKPTTVKNKARQSSYCAFLWKPASEVYTGKWKRVEYNNSSPFALWWCDITADEQ